MGRLEEKLAALSPTVLQGMRCGVEKESLRVQPDGRLATTPHARALGSALAHPHITTDFSESQLELITDPHPSPEACLEELTHIHQAVYGAIGEEMLWVASMPCGLPDDDAIPLGQYGSSNIGRAKTVYRMGLAWRYGRRMQTISGIHYNWSLPGLSNDDYFALLRNFRRHGWLLFYLFGASPAVCSSFVAGREHGLKELKRGNLYLPHATTLRMGRLGYQSAAQNAITASFNSLETYGASLEQALTRSHPPYEAIGIQVDGEYRQLATTLIQIENEYYGKVRPKCRIHSGERPLHALRQRGVEYLEVRLMDLDPFAPVGITAQTMRTLDVFLLHCLLAESPPDTPEEIAAIARNQERVAARGREPGLTLARGSESIALQVWGEEILGACAPIAAALDRVFGSDRYRAALAGAQNLLRDPDATPSARILAAMRERHDNSYTRFVLERSREAARELRERAFAPEVAARYAKMAEQSLAKQLQIEAADTLDFEAWRRDYVSPARLRA